MVKTLLSELQTLTKKETDAGNNRPWITISQDEQQSVRRLQLKGLVKVESYGNLMMAMLTDSGVTAA